MTERDAYLQLLVDGSKALSGITALEAALEKLADKAELTQGALDKLGTKRGVTTTRAPASGPTAAQTAAPAIRAEQAISAARTREAQAGMRAQNDFAAKRITLSRTVARAEQTALAETMAFRQRMLDQQQRQEAGRKQGGTGSKVVLGDPETASPQQTMAFQSRMQSQKANTTDRSSGQMDRIRAQAEAENVRRDQQAYDNMRREAEAENRARTEASRQYNRMRAAAEGENLQRDRRAYDNMRREAEAENAVRTRVQRQNNTLRAAAEAENIRRDQQAYDRMRREAEAENARRTRESRRYDSMRSQAEADNARFDRQAMAATRAQAEAENRARDRASRQAQSQTSRADQQRRSMVVPPSSPAFVGPMPETRRQVSQRQETAKATTYDASVAIEQSMKKLSRLTMPTFDTSTAVKHAEKLSEAFGKVGASFTSMNGMIAGIGIVAVGQSIAKAGMAMESLQKGLDVATGSSAQGKVEMERLRTEADRLGVDIQHTGKEYVNFAAAIKGGNVDADKAKDTFFAVAQAMALLGRSPEQAGRAFKALEQFASKGQVMSEELKGQLSEQLPGAFAIAAKSLGMSAQELGTAMANGALDANRLFSVFGDAIRGDFAIAGDKVDTATAAFSRFNNALFEIKATIANGGFLKALADGADEFAKFLKSDAGQESARQIGDALKGAVETLVGGLKLLMENIELTKGAMIGLVGLGIVKWVGELAAAFGVLAVQLSLLATFMMANPLFAIASVALAGAAAIYIYSKSVTQATKAQLEHNQAMKDLKSLQDKLKATPSGNKDEIAEHRAAITVIRDRAREEQKRYDDNIKKAKELSKYEEAMASTGLGAEFGGLGTDIASMFGMGAGESIEKQKREMELARQRERAAQRALMVGQTGFTGGMTNAGTQSAINDTPMADNLRKSLAEVERLISEQGKLAEAFTRSAAAAAEIKSELEMASKIKEFDGKVSAEGLEQLKAKYQELRDVKEQVAAGPVLQEMRQSIADLDALSSAHNRGGDAANTERIAQEARNKAVEAGIRISGAAADEIFRLAQAHDEAAKSEMLSARRAEINQNIQDEQRRTDILVNQAGTPRIALLGALQETENLRAKGINPDDERPTKFNAEVQATIQAGARQEVAKTTEERKRENAALELQVDTMGKLAALERGRSEKKAKEAGELRGLIELRSKLGNVEMKDLSEEDKQYVALKGKESVEQFKIQQGNRVGRSAPQDIYGEKLRELSESITAERELASAQNEGAAAVENQTRKQAIMNQVHALSEKLTAGQKAKLEELIGTLYDAKTASAFEGAKMDLRDEISQIEAMAQAELKSAEAANMEALAQEARQRAIELGVVGNDEAIRSLEELMAARLRANQEKEIAQGTRANRDTIDELNEEREALKLVGVERIRRLGELQAEQELRSQGTPRDTKGADAFVESGGNRAIAEYSDAQERAIGSSERGIVAIENQTGALSLLGEAYVRRSAELQMEAQLIEQNGAATDEYSQKMIQLAGDTAVATDQLNRQNDALRGLADSGLSLNEQMRSLSHDGLMAFEDALVDIITGTKGVKEAFASMAKSIAADLARMAIRQAITIPLAMGLNSMFMGGAGMAATGAPMALGGAMGGGMPFHTGGIVGQDTSPIRSVPSSTFSTAPRFHTGKPGAAKEPALKAGEMPAILKRDEGVFTPAQMASLAPAGAANSNTVVLSPTINVTQPQGATEEQGQKFGKGIVREMQGMVDERINRAFRPGGIRNQSGF